MLDYIIIGLLVVIIILSIILLLKKSNNTETVRELGNFKNDITKEISEFRYGFSKDLLDNFDKVNDKLDRKLNDMNDKVNERLDASFEKTNKTFGNILERLSKIDEAQKNIDSLSKDIVNLQSVLTDKKTRGIFGEVNLNYILTSVFGEKKVVYDIQKHMPNGSIADAIIYAPEPLGTICIDSKFPLENYEKMSNRELPRPEREAAMKLFESDVKKHIDAIADKYIITGVTANEAIMFLPAEALFAELNAYHTKLLEYAYSRRVWICGPTTLMSTLSTIQMVIKDAERDKYAKVISDELNKLGVEFKRYKDRWDKLARDIENVSSDVKDIHTTSEKISKKFNSISSADIEELEYKEENL